MSLQTWIIEPRDSLIVRDGKPFGASITHATSLDFPFPSTTTGGVRTRAGLDSATGFFDTLLISTIKEIEVKGPLLVGLNADSNKIANYYLSSPADALLIQDDEQKIKGEFSIKRLLPLKIGDAITYLPNNLKPVGITEHYSKVKPYTDLKFWNWQTLKDWLLAEKKFEKGTPDNFGIKNLLKDSRTHVAINLDLASDDGDLFSIRGLEFNYGKDNLPAIKFALAVFVDDAIGNKLESQGNLAPLGGERRLVSWRKSEVSKSDSTDHLPLECPKEIKTQIIKDGHCRLMLLTPAYFSDGLPKSNDEYEVQAIACNRYQTVSGWDFESNCPKPTCRLLPAGSVLFLKLNSDDKTLREKWIDATWFSCISDFDSKTKQDFAKDGFGLSILGTWDGNPLEMK